MKVGRETRWVVWLSGLLAGLAGCDPAGASRAPVAPLVGVVAKPTAGAAQPSPTTQIALVVPSESNDTIRAWIQVVREQSGKRGVFLELKQPDPGSPHAQQAEMIHEAVRQGAKALIVVASEGDDVPKALAEESAKGVPIVILGRPVKFEGKPQVTITSSPLAESARVIALAALADAKTGGASVDGPAVVLINSKLDEQSEERKAALEKALKDAGVKRVLTVPFGAGDAAPDAADAQKTVEATYDAHHDLAMVLATDDDGLSGAVQARYSTEPNSKFVIAGFAARPTTSNLALIRESSAVVETRVLKLAEQATDIAVRMVRGEKFEPELVIAHRTRRSAGPRPQGGAAKFIGISAPAPRESKKAVDLPKITPPPVKD